MLNFLAMTSNSMLTLEIYWYANSWCFNDEAKDLQQEPFVFGMSEIIDHVIEQTELGDCETYEVLFSAQAFPRAQGFLQYEYAELDGVWYTLQEDPENLKSLQDADVMTGWLCPATLKYFRTHPKRIYYKIKEGRSLVIL
jgi:hypothetical protein